MREFSPAKSMAWSWLGLAFTCLPIAIFRLMTDDSLRVFQAATVMLGLCGLFSWRGLRVLRGDDTVSLSREGLEGPARHFGPILWGPRIRIALSGLDHFQEVGWGVWRAEGRRGQCLYWTDTHEGHNELLMLLGLSLRMSGSRS